MSEVTESSNVGAEGSGDVTEQATEEHNAGDANVGADNAVGGEKNVGGGHAVLSRMNKRNVMVVVIIVIILLLGFMFWQSIPVGSGGASKYPIAWFIIIAAISGSVVNESFRESLEHQPTYGWIVTYIAWKGAVSIVSAFLLYLMTIGGLIGGDLFPEFIETALKQGETWSMEAFVTKVDPKASKDIAKILVWSFIAGYSEKFVPNLIGKILKTPDGKVIKSFK